jgi:hypothetical protein
MKRGLAYVAISVALVRPGPLAAQWWDAQLPRGGELQIGLAGVNQTVDARFGPDGALAPLRDVLGTRLDPRLVPELDSLDAALAGLFSSVGLPVPGTSTLGDLRYDVLLERTRAPITVALGATDWLTLFAVVPIVQGRSFVTAQLDSLTANAGPAGTAFGGDPAGFLQGLDAGISQLEAIVAADTLAANLQADAERLLADARVLEAGFSVLAQGAYVPTASGDAGRQLASVYEAVRTGFQGFQVEIPALSLAGAVPADDGAALVPWSEFGIEPPRDRSTGIRFGDIEVGLSLQPLNTFRRPTATRPAIPVRVRLDALYRLATGAPPAPERLTDVGTGDGQPDVEFRGTLDAGFGRRFWLSLFTGYNVQLEATVERLVTSRASPIQPGAYRARLRWNPGDVLTVAAIPRFNFTPVITFSALVQATRHGRDRVQAVDPVDPGAAFAPADLEEGTGYTSRAFGLAVRFSTTRWHGARRKGIPAEVEVSYLRTTSGRDGLAPRLSVWRVGLRYYQTLFR